MYAQKVPKQEIINWYRSGWSDELLEHIGANDAYGHPDGCVSEPNASTTSADRPDSNRIVVQYMWHAWVVLISVVVCMTVAKMLRAAADLWAVYRAVRVARAWFVRSSSLVMSLFVLARLFSLLFSVVSLVSLVSFSSPLP